MRIAPLLAAVVVAHCGFALLRLPKLWVKRQDEVAAFRQRGDAEYLLTGGGLTGTDVIERLRRETPEQCAIVIRGESRGAMEFAAALLFPRLLVHDALVPKDATSVFARPLARGAQGVVALRGLGRSLSLEPR